MYRRRPVRNVCLGVNDDAMTILMTAGPLGGTEEMNECILPIA
jgi:hypothetical protein